MPSGSPMASVKGYDLQPSQLRDEYVANIYSETVHDQELIPYLTNLDLLPGW
jgi:hypothetical protein